MATTSSWAPSPAGAGIDRDRLAVVEKGGDLLEIGICRANEWTPRMNGVRRFVVRGALAMSAGTTSTATPRFVNAAWQAATVLRRACSGVTIISQ